MSISYRSPIYYFYFKISPNSYGRKSDHRCIVQVFFEQFFLDHDPVSVFQQEFGIDISLLEYWGWLTKASEALAAYLAGTLSEKEAMEIIYVPRKDELLENNSSELTVETAVPQS